MGNLVPPNLIQDDPRNKSVLQLIVDNALKAAKEHHAAQERERVQAARNQAEIDQSQKAHRERQSDRYWCWY